MSVLEKLGNLVNEAAEIAAVNMSETGTGGGAGKVLETGMYPARLVEYVEHGKQKNQYEPSKPPRDIAELRFAVWEIGEDGAMEGPYFVGSFGQTISNHERAGLKQFFDKMNWRNDATKKHTAQFLGADCFLKVEKRQNKAKTAEYNVAVITEVQPPRDPMTGQPYTFPELDDDTYRLFLWDKPTKETWESLYIEGTNDKGESKNFIQERIMKAVNFPGSALEQLLLSSGVDIPAPALEQAVPEAPAIDGAPEQTPVQTPVQPTVQPPAQAGAAEDVPWEQEAPAQAPAVPAAPTVPAAPEVPAMPAAVTGTK